MALFKIPKTREIGRCIYCGTTEGRLTNEHAIPYGLNGNYILTRASCDACAKITTHIERDTMRGLWPQIRTVLAMKSYHKKKRSKTLSLVLRKDGVESSAEVALEDFPLCIACPVIPPPGITLKRTPAKDVPYDLQFIRIAGPTFEEVAKRHGADEVFDKISFHPSLFGRSLAKIAYCAAVAALGLDALSLSPLPAIILGTDIFVWHWVGGWNRDQVTEPKGTHALQLLERDTQLHVVLRLFAQFNAPEYHVVIGLAHPDFANSEAWPWKTHRQP